MNITRPPCIFGGIIKYCAEISKQIAELHDHVDLARQGMSSARRGRSSLISTFVLIVKSRTATGKVEFHNILHHLRTFWEALAGGYRITST